LHCAIREDKIRHTGLLIRYGHAHDALNQNNLTPIQLAQKLGRTRILGFLDNPASRQRLVMKPKPQFANTKVDPLQPAAPPVAPAEPASQPLKKGVPPSTPDEPPERPNQLIYHTCRRLCRCFSGRRPIPHIPPYIRLGDYACRHRE
jgi:hypothetical protein